MNREIINKVDKSFVMVREIPLTKLKGTLRAKYGIQDLKVGSAIRFERNLYLVTAKYKYYKNKKDVLTGEEFQLTNPLTGEVRYLEYSIEDTIELYVTTKELSKREVSDMLPASNYGFIKKEVGDFLFDGKEYFYDDDWKSRFVVSGEDISNAEVVRMVEFESGVNEGEYLTFEYWEDDRLEVFVSTEVSAYEIEIQSI